MPADAAAHAFNKPSLANTPMARLSPKVTAPLPLMVASEMPDISEAALYVSPSFLIA